MDRDPFERSRGGKSGDKARPKCSEESLGSSEGRMSTPGRGSGSGSGSGSGGRNNISDEGSGTVRGSDSGSVSGDDKDAQRGREVMRDSKRGSEGSREER